MSNDDRFTPKQNSESDEQERQGNLIIHNLLKENPAVLFRPAGNDKTPNQDGTIELLNDKRVIVGKLEIQIRPVDPQRTDRPCYQVQASLVGYARVNGLPFLLICYDRKSNKAYWTKIDDSLFQGVKETQKSVTVNFETTEEIANGKPYFEEWLKISQEHLKLHHQAEQIKRVMAALESAGGNKFLGLTDSPEQLAEFMQQLIDTSNEKYKARLTEAQKLFRENEIGAATKIVADLESELESEMPDTELLVSVRNCLGNCYIRLEKFDDAEKTFRSAMKEGNASWKSKTNLAHILYVRNTSKAEALALVGEAYKVEPENEFVLAIYLLCLSFNGKQVEFDQILKDRAEFIAKSAEVQLALAQCHSDKKQYDQARKKYEAARDLDKNNPHIQIFLAEVIYKSIRTTNLSLLSKNIIPKLEDSSGDVESAIAGLDAAISELSKTSDKKAHFRAYELRALLDMLGGDHNSAKTDCDKMSAILPDDESWKIIKAQVFTQTIEFEEADKILKPLAEGRRRDVLQILAYSNHKLGNHESASKYFTGYIEETDSEQEWTAYLQSLWLSGDRKTAYLEARKMRKAGRASAMIMRDVELKRLIELKEWRNTLEVLEDLLRVEPSNAEHYLNRIAMNMNLGDREQVFALYQALPRELIESDGWARAHLATLEQELRQLRWI